MFVLPVSRIPIQLRAPDGRDELLLAEGASHPYRLRLEVVSALAPPCASGAEWRSLPFADVDAALLALRRRLIGDRIVAEVLCDGCGAPGDVDLSIAAYLAANRPGRVRGAVLGPDGWWSWEGHRFRVPTVTDVLDVVECAGPDRAAARQLGRRCVVADSPRGFARAGAALDRLAPPLCGPIRGACPACGGYVTSWFDPGAFVLAELQVRAGVVFDQVHLLASSYGWSESDILALPSRRRASYAARIADERRIS